MHHVNWRDCSALIYLAAVSSVALYCTQPCRITVSYLQPRLFMHDSSRCRGMCSGRCELFGGSASNPGTRQRISCHRAMAVPACLPRRLAGANARSEHPVWALASKHAVCRCGLVYGDDTCREWDLQWPCHLLHARNVDVLARTRPCTQDLHCL